MDILVLLRRGNKIPTEGETETNCGAETEGKTIQRLPHLVVIHPIDSHKTQTLLSMPTDAHKYLLTGAGYSFHLGDWASA